MFYKRTTVAGLALLSLLAVNTGLAEEVSASQTPLVATVAAGQVDRDLLKQESAAAAKKAAEAVLADTKLDLDIRLIGPTSVKIAGDR